MEERSNGCSTGGTPPTQMLNGTRDGLYPSDDLNNSHYTIKEGIETIYRDRPPPGDPPYPGRDSVRDVYPTCEGDTSIHPAAKDLGGGKYPVKELDTSEDRGEGVYPMKLTKRAENSIYPSKDGDRGSIYPSKDGDRGSSIYPSKDGDRGMISTSEGVGVEHKDVTYPDRVSGDIYDPGKLGEDFHPAKTINQSNSVHPSVKDKGISCPTPHQVKGGGGGMKYPIKAAKPKPDGTTTTSTTQDGGTSTKPPTPFRRQNRIDFPTIACKICGDRSSGVHYGIISCEGCKGFFRRCLRRKKEYICPKGGKCEISRHQRNRCPSCRYKKCIELGMSKEAVRIGRIPNKQKETEFVDIEPYVVEEIKDLDDPDLLKEIIIDEDTEKLIQTAGEAHKNTAKSYPELNDYLSGKRKRRDLDECPTSDISVVEEAIKGMDGRELWSNVISEALAIYIKRIVTFCKQIPGFTDLGQHDQMILVKAGFFEILTVQDTVELNLYNAFLLDKGLKVSKAVMKKFMPPELQVALYQFADRLHGRLKLTPTELALLSAIVLFSDDRENLHDQEAVARTQTKYLHALQMQLLKNHRKDSLMFAKVLLTLPILRTVDDLHNQFIMQLKIGVGETNSIPMPQLYKEVYDLPSKSGAAGGAAGGGPPNGKVASTSRHHSSPAAVAKTKEEAKEYSSCQRSGGNSASPSPVASVHSAPPTPGGRTGHIGFSMENLFARHAANAGLSHSGNFGDHGPPDMGFRHQLGVAMAQQGVRPPGSPGGPCRQSPYSALHHPYKHSAPSGAFRHQLALEEPPGGSCSHLMGGPHHGGGGMHRPAAWSPEMERDYHILNRSIKEEVPDYDGSCL